MGKKFQKGNKASAGIPCVLGGKGSFKSYRETFEKFQAMTSYELDLVDPDAIPAYEVMILQQVRQAMRGKGDAIDRVMDRVEGKSRQTVLNITPEDLPPDEDILGRHGIKPRD